MAQHAAMQQMSALVQGRSAAASGLQKRSCQSWAEAVVLVQVMLPGMMLGISVGACRNCYPLLAVLAYELTAKPVGRRAAECHSAALAHGHNPGLLSAVHRQQQVHQLLRAVLQVPRTICSEAAGCGCNISAPCT